MMDDTTFLTCSEGILYPPFYIVGFDHEWPFDTVLPDDKVYFNAL
jgi:hypothetical protein